MRDFTVALCQLAPKLGDLASNLDLHLETIAEARRRGADVAVFPELSLTGYVLRDQVPDVALAGGAPILQRLAEASRNIDVAVGFVEEGPGSRFHNAAGYWSGGRLLHLHRKVYLPTYGMFEEGRDFAPGERLRAFDAPSARTGLLVCEDLWHPSCAWLLAQQGAELFVTLSSGPSRGSKPGHGVTSVEVWSQLLRVTAQFQTCWIVFVNRVGVEDGLTFGGGSLVIDPFGRATLEMPALEPGLALATLRGEVLRRARVAYPLLRDENLELVHREIARLRAERFDLPDEHGSEPLGTMPEGHGR